MPKNPVISRVFGVFSLSLLSSKYQKGIEPILIFVGRPPHPPKSKVRSSDCRSVWRSVKGTLLNAPSLRSVRLPLYPLDSPPFAVHRLSPKKGTVEAKASTALFRLPIILQKSTSLVCGGWEYLQGALPPAPPASPRNSRRLRPARARVQSRV